MENTQPAQGSALMYDSRAEHRGAGGGKGGEGGGAFYGPRRFCFFALRALFDDHIVPGTRVVARVVSKTAVASSSHIILIGESKTQRAVNPTRR